MNLVKRCIVYILSLITISILFGISNLYLFDLLTYFSPKNEVKPHFVVTVKHELLVLFIVSIIMLTFLLFVLPYLKKYTQTKFDFNEIFSFESNNLKKVLLVFIVLYIFIAPLFVLYSLDISTDESTYAYTGYHYYNYGKFMIKFDNDNFIIPKDMYLQNIPLMVLKPFVPYSINVMRYITYFYSMLFVIMIYYFFRNKYGIVTSKIFILIVASYTGFIFLSGTSYGENSAFLFSLVSVVLFSQYYETNKMKGLHISALLMSLSIITKIQLGIFIIPSLILFAVYYYLRGKEYTYILKYFGEVIVFSLLLISLLWLTNYNFKEIKSLIAIYYSISVNSVTYAESWLNILINFERFFNYQMLLFAPIVFYYFYSRKYVKSFVEKYFFLVFILNAIWFITMKGYNFRFMYFAQFGIMLLSVRPISIFYTESSLKIKNTIKVLFSVIILIAFIQNTKMSINGVNNDYLFFLNGNNPLKTFFKFNHNNDQKEFYDKVKTIIDSNETVYYVGAEFEIMAFVPNKFYTFDVTTYNPELNIKYIIRTSINDQLDINISANDFLKTNCDKVFEKGLYSLYKIK